MDERRNFSRVDFAVEALLKQGAASFKGEVRNISLKGILVETSETLVPASPVEVTIYLTGMPPYIAINATGTLVRIEGNCVGIKFDKIDADSFAHLRNIVSYRCGDADKVIGEFFTYLDGRNRND